MQLWDIGLLDICAIVCSPVTLPEQREANDGLNEGGLGSQLLVKADQTRSAQYDFVVLAFPGFGSGVEDAECFSIYLEQLV